MQKQRQGPRKPPDEAHAHPYGTLASLETQLKDFSPPVAAFDPTAAWTHSYIVHLEGARRSPAGFLQIRREPVKDGAIQHVESRIVHDNGGQHTIATMQCATDVLCTPRSWKLESVMLDADGKPLAVTRLTQNAIVKGAALETQTGSRKRSTKLTLPVTSNWGLFDAVQRLPEKATPIRFTLLEELDLLKANQRLSFSETTTFKQMRLTSYEQTGDGVLPFHYCVDERHRVLFVLSGQRSYIWDPDARNRVGKLEPRRKS